MIIAIEGMDGSGKTTVAKSIEKELKFKYVKEPLKELFEIDDKHIEKISKKIFDNKDIKLKAWYLALGDIFALNQYKNENIVMDRHVLLNYYWNGNEQSKEIFDTQVKLFGKPDLTIILYASPEIRLNRILNRNPNDPDLQKDNMKKNGYDKLLEFVKKYKYNYVVIDTDNLSIDEVIKKCINQIETLADEHN